MIDPKLLEKLACPETHQALRLATADELAALGKCVAGGGCKNVGGQPVEAAPEAGLVREDGALLYPIRDELPRLLVEEGIALPAAS